MSKPSLSAELLSVGTELLMGEIVDTNSAWLASDLAQRGVDVYWSQRLGDNLGRIVHAVRQALERSDLVVICGGLGPTDDDMTREAVAKVLGETPEVDTGLERDLREKFASFSRRMPEKNIKQAWLIPSAETLPNPRGTAPGWLVTTQVQNTTRRIVTLPGPPRELKRMWIEEVLPRLELPETAFFFKTFKTHGLGESTLAERLGDLTQSANPSVATYAKADGVHVRVAAKAQSLTEAEACALSAVRDVQDALKGHIWGSGDDELPDLIAKQLKARGLTLALVENASGGLISHLLTRVTEAARFFRGCVVAYSPQARAAVGVSKDELGADNSQTATEEMAQAAARLLKADLGLAVSGLISDAARTNQGEGKPTYEVYVALWQAQFQAATQFKLPYLGQDWLRERLSYSTLYFLWKHLTERK